MSIGQGRQYPLYQRWAPEARVLREGKITKVKSEEVVPEDILVLIPGTRIAADNFLVKLYQPMVTYKLMSHH